jgi:CheY-like chemotaxis protein
MVAESSVVAATRNTSSWNPPNADSNPTHPISGHGTGSSDTGDPAMKKVTRRIAIVEDEKDLALMFSILLKTLGYLTEYVAHDGTEIVQAVSDGSIHPDLILMDYRMPKMNGLEAAEKLRVLRPDLKIIIATADDSVRQATISAGLMFIQKPFSMRVLAKTIENAFP